MFSTRTLQVTPVSVPVFCLVLYSDWYTALLWWHFFFLQVGVRDRAGQWYKNESHEELQKGNKQRLLLQGLGGLLWAAWLTWTWWTPHPSEEKLFISLDEQKRTCLHFESPWRHFALRWILLLLTEHQDECLIMSVLRGVLMQEGDLGWKTWVKRAVKVTGSSVSGNSLSQVL